MLSRDLGEYGRYYARSMDMVLAGKQASSNWSPDHPGVTDLLRESEIVECALVPSGSNYTYLLTLRHSGAGEGLAIYKPRAGEAPLWDFPTGSLYRREVAAYELSRIIGWDLVPPTVARDGPDGPGAVQLLIDADHAQNYFTLRHGRRHDLQRMALFDCLANNADRKGGHCLLARDGRLWGIDHGLTFHEQWKLRTVIWDFCDEPLPRPLLADLACLRDRLRDAPDDFGPLFGLIGATERRAFESRLERLLQHPYFPQPGPHRSVPWPPV